MRIGPAGNSRRFYEEGFKKSEQAPAWIRSQGLSAYEYSFGRGVNISEETARAIGLEATKHDIRMSVHAPYYINCASDKPENREKSVEYLLKSARAADWMGARRIVFHVGSPGKLPRESAMAYAMETIHKAHEALDAEGYSSITLCPETMGRASQIGTLQEILSICREDSRLLPTLDFGHLHTIDLGALNRKEDFLQILKRMIDALGHARVKNFHAHFSHIQYGPKGELRHMNFSDPGYGPDFHLLAPALVEMDLSPVILCESAGAQADDAAEMLRIFTDAQENSSFHRIVNHSRI